MTVAHRRAAAAPKPLNRKRDPIAMPNCPKPIAALLVIAGVAACAAGCDRFSSANSSHSDQASKEAPKSPTPAAALLPPPAPAAAQPAQRMTPSQQAAFDAWLVKTYLACWKPAPQPAEADPYVAQVRLAYNPDGSLSKPAKLVNPPSDPSLKPQAKSVLLAVQNCNPLPVPAQYRPYYEQWKTRTIHFNPEIAAR